MPSTIRDTTIWAVIVIYALFTVSKPLLLGTGLWSLVPMVSILSMLGFVLLHGPRQMGWGSVLVFFIIAWAISWGLETSSVLTGFPFGNYHYTQRMGPKLGLVPLLIMPAYFAVCYVSFYLARILLHRFDRKGEVEDIVLVPVVATFIMVMWDLSMDPARANISQSWIWEDGGGYFGVPLQNFMGWTLCVWTIFQVNVLVQRRLPARGVDGTAADRKVHWWQCLGLYAAIFVEFPSYAALGPDGPITDATGQAWDALDMYQSLGLVSSFTMGFVIVLTAITLARQSRLQ